MNKRSILRAVTAFTLVAGLWACQKKVAPDPDNAKQGGGAQNAALLSATTPTNVIFILVDDMSWDVYQSWVMSCGSKANTPTLYAMASIGITFTNYWTHPSCTPSRAALFSGKYGYKTGVGSNHGSKLPVMPIIPGHISSKNSNYSNAVFGKWGITDISTTATASSPSSFGVQSYMLTHIGNGSYTNYTQDINGAISSGSKYLTTAVVDQALGWLNNRTNPFVMFLTFNAPHEPFHLPPANLITNTGLSPSQSAINANPMPYYLAAIEAMDKEIGRLYWSMSATQRANTLFIFAADNGTPKAVAQCQYNSTRSKGTLYNGGINTPLLMWGKGVTRGGVRDASLVQAEDMFATIADIVGVNVPAGTTGVSIKPLLSAAGPNIRKFSYIDFFGPTPNSDYGYAIRNDRYKLIKWDNGTKAFFDLQTDPYEKTNLFTSKANLNATEQSNLTAIQNFKNNLP